LSEGAAIVAGIAGLWLKRLTGVWSAPLINLVLRLTRWQRGLALVYHRIGMREGDPESELVPALPVSRFDRQLRHLCRFYAVVPADELPAAAARRRRGERFPVSVTFDDDLPEHLEYALPALLRRGVVATFFLCGRRLDANEPRSTWWERLQRAIDRGVAMSLVSAAVPSVSTREHDERSPDIHSLALAMEELSPGERELAAERLRELGGDDPIDTGLDVTGIGVLAASGQRIGFHTRRHDPLTRLDDEALDRALTDGRAELEGAAGSPVTTVAYPHGDVDRRVATAASQVGYRLGFTATRAAVTPTVDPMMVGRFDPTTLRGREWRSQGAFGLAVLRGLMTGTGEGR
jgi:peptidoglycan/xylan/chitin deacetylase (PgdA/CDA1 family)